MLESTRRLEERLRQLYYAEHERRHKLNSTATTPIALVTLLAGVAAYFFRVAASASGRCLCQILLFVSAVVLGVSVIVAIFFLIRALHNHTYGFVSTPGEILHYVMEYRRYFSDSGATSIDDKVEEHLSELLIGQYGRYGDVSALSNDRKSKAFHYVQVCLIVALVAMVVGGLPCHIVETRTKAEMKSAAIVFEKGGEVYIVRGTQATAAGCGTVKRSPTAVTATGTTPKGGTEPRDSGRAGREGEGVVVPTSSPVKATSTSPAVHPQAQSSQHEGGN